MNFIIILSLGIGVGYLLGQHHAYNIASKDLDRISKKYASDLEFLEQLYKSRK